MSHAWTKLEGSGVGYVRSDWKESFDHAGLRSMNDFFQVTGEPLSKPGLGGRYRARLRLGVGSETKAVYLKRFQNEKWGSALRRWYEDGAAHSPAEREVRVAAGLAKLGLPVPRPLAWGRLGPAWRSESFVILSEVPGEPADRFLQRIDQTGPALSWPEKQQLLRQMADLVRRFHEAGWRHRDLYLCHFFVERAPAAWSVALIDLQRVFRPRWRRRRWQIKDLSQLNFSAASQQFSRTRRLRFFLWHLGLEKLTPEAKGLLRGVLRKTAKLSKRHGGGGAR